MSDLDAMQLVLGNRKVLFPSDHRVGMRVTKGGSMCANCEYLADAKTCENKYFIRWNGTGKLPAPADEFCCDFWEAA